MKADYAEFRRQARESRVGFVVRAQRATRRWRCPPRSGSASTRRAGAAAASASPRRYADLLTSKEANDTAAEFFRAKIRAIVRDPAVAELLSPAGLSARHQAHLRRHRLLRDVQPRQRHAGRRPQRRRSRRSPRRACGRGGAEYALDSIVFATGFDAMTGALLNIDIRGRGGRTLQREVGRRAAHLPRPRRRRLPEPLHHHRPRQPVGAQQHDRVHRAARRLDRRLPRLPARARPRRRSRPRAEAEDGVGGPRQRGGPTPRSIRCANSWYMGANIPGKPRIFMPYIGGVGAYRQNCDDVAARGYEGFKPTG